jgi:hypothetical protein
MTDPSGGMLRLIRVALVIDDTVEPGDQDIGKFARGFLNAVCFSRVGGTSKALEILDRHEDEARLSVLGDGNRLARGRMGYRFEVTQQIDSRECAHFSGFLRKVEIYDYFDYDANSGQKPARR